MTTTEQEAWVKRFDKEFGPDYLECFSDELIDKVKAFVAQERKLVSQDICRIIDDIELGYRGTSLAEWKAFKHIRNAIRDTFEPEGFQQSLGGESK